MVREPPVHELVPEREPDGRHRDAGGERQDHGERQDGLLEDQPQSEAEFTWRNQAGHFRHLRMRAWPRS